MRGTYTILFGILGLLIFGCVSPVMPEGDGEAVVITTDQECPGCAPAVEEPEEEAPEEEEPLIGGDRDAHGCIPSAGYTWCEAKQKCLRVWEEPCIEGSITLDEARAIAMNSSCMEEGNLTDDYIYNNITRTWWFDMDVDKPGCAPACVVDELGKTAEINWRCTGLIVPENETVEENETEVPDRYANATGCVGPDQTQYDIYVQNETWFQGKIYADECALATVVKDYYCKDGEVASINTECPNGYDCRNGICKPMEYKCSKTFGNDTTQRGHIVVSKGLNPILDEYDECVDEGTVKEWICYEDGTGGYELLYCGTGMRCPDEEGRCVRSSCVETDDGDDPAHFGEITFKDRDDEYRDVCISDARLKEYYCYGNSVESRTYTCMNESCVDDECVPEYT